MMVCRSQCSPMVNRHLHSQYRTGVKQGCLLAHTLFSIMFHALLKDAYRKGADGLNIKFRFDTGVVFNLKRLQAKTKSVEKIEYGGCSNRTSTNDKNSSKAPKERANMPSTLTCSSALIAQDNFMPEVWSTTCAHKNSTTNQLNFDWRWSSSTWRTKKKNIVFSILSLGNFCWLHVNCNH